MNDSEYAEMIRKMDEEIVIEGYSRGELSKAFDNIKNKENWKMPINAVIHREDYRICSLAVEFFCGSFLSRQSICGCPDEILVHSEGYYSAVGA